MLSRKEPITGAMHHIRRGTVYFAQAAVSYIMAQGSKQSYTDKQKRQARKIEESAKERGYSQKRAEEIGWATVNKEHGGAKKRKTESKSGKGTSRTKSGSNSGGSKSGGGRGGSRS